MEKYKTLRIFLLEKEIRGVREMLLKLEIFFYSSTRPQFGSLHPHQGQVCVCSCVGVQCV